MIQIPAIPTTADEARAFIRWTEAHIDTATPADLERIDAGIEACYDLIPNVAEIASAAYDEIHS